MKENIKELIKQYLTLIYEASENGADALINQLVRKIMQSLTPSVSDEEMPYPASPLKGESLPNHLPSEGDEKICTGCGHIESDGLKHGFACCPDNKHLPLREFLKAWHKDNEQKAEFVRKHIKSDELVEALKKIREIAYQETHCQRTIIGIRNLTEQALKQKGDTK